MYAKPRCEVSQSSFFPLEWNLILDSHASESSQLNEADGIPVCFLLYQPTRAFGDHDLFLLSISENTQGMPKACVTVTVLQIAQWAVFRRWSCTSGFCTVRNKMSLFLFCQGGNVSFSLSCLLLVGFYCHYILPSWARFGRSIPLIQWVRWVVLSCSCTVKNWERSKASSFK